MYGCLLGTEMSVSACKALESVGICVDTRGQAKVFLGLCSPGLLRQGTHKGLSLPAYHQEHKHLSLGLNFFFTRVLGLELSYLDLQAKLFPNGAPYFSQTEQAICKSKKREILWVKQAVIQSNPSHLRPDTLANPRTILSRTYSP